MLFSAKYRLKLQYFAQYSAFLSQIFINSALLSQNSLVSAFNVFATNTRFLDP